jgi:pyridoxal/pyridoxine/pyridoxamine kinase
LKEVILPVKILTIHSLAVHGTASLKAMLSLLGTRVLPVPSLYLTGLTNLPGVRTFDVAFAELLRGSLALARLRGERLWLYVGYLGTPGQGETILALRDEFADLIEGTIVDPVSGDHGRTYVPAEVIAAWPRLLAVADWAFPNYTELQLHSGLPMGKASTEAYLAAFHARFPALNFVATSLPAGSALGLHLQWGAQVFRYQHPRLDRLYGGTGDVFAAKFLDAYLFAGTPPDLAMQQAADGTLALIQQAIDLPSEDLIL